MSTKKNRYFYVALAIWVPTFFVARTGFFFGAIFIFVYFLSVKRISGLLRAVFVRTNGLIGMALISAPLVVIFTNLNYVFEPEALERVDFAVRWGFELFLNAQTGAAKTDTTEALLNMLVIPQELSFFMFGFGVFDTGAFDYKRTDSGYLKTWYSSGLLGVIVFYGTVYFSLLHVAWRQNDRHFMIFMIYFVCTMAISEIKEPFLYQNYLGRFVFILIGAGIVINACERRCRVRSKPNPPKV